MLNNHKYSQCLHLGWEVYQGDEEDDFQSPTAAVGKLAATTLIDVAAEPCKTEAVEMFNHITTNTL